MTWSARSRPIQLMSAAGSCMPPVVAPRGERPGKNEQPRPITGFTPIRHHVAELRSSRTQIRLGDTAHNRTLMHGGSHPTRPGSGVSHVTP